jgi:diguanylate cyclase (GGDEF)-like protein
VRRTSIVTRITVAVTLTLVVFALCMLTLIKTEMQQEIYRATALRVRMGQEMLLAALGAKGRPSLSGGTLRLGRWIANGDNSLVDELRIVAGTDASLFAVIAGQPHLVTTSIVSSSGSRNIGVQLRGPARAAFDAGHGYSGRSLVAGQDSLGSYTLLRQDGGKVIGVAYTGASLADARDGVWEAMQTVLLVTAITLCLGFGVLYIVLRPLRRAFADTLVMAQGLAAGDVDQRTRSVSDDELGDVNLAFQEMIRYQQRMAAAADSIAARNFSVKVEPVSARDRLGVAFASMRHNLSDLVSQLERAALTDGLTQLGNRRAYELRIHAELSRTTRQGGKLSLALVNVDNFKAINDEHGHQRGDAVLQKLGRVLRHSRAEDSAYRLGGDEFAIILTGSDLGEAKVALERMRAEAQAELFGSTITIGAATALRGMKDGDALHRQAGAALDVGKRRGRNTVVTYDEAQSRELVAQQALAASVTQLIEERHLQICFQPIWDVRRGTILGFEALARPYAKYGLAGPQEAFDVAAAIDRAHDLDRICREAAIARAVELPGGTLLFLNVSPQTLARELLEPRTLAASFAEVGLLPERVVLEITERFAGPAEAVIAAAERLQRFGFKLALDDTGAGNAGLEYLSRLRVDYIKIDAAIVANAPLDMAARGVIAAVVALAATTGAYVIAEGIEDQATLDSIRGLDGTDRRKTHDVRGVQGYFLGRPEEDFITARQPEVSALLRGGAPAGAAAR